MPDLRDYCGFHSGSWPVVQADRASAVREVFEAYSEKEPDEGSRMSHRDSLRAPADFERAFRAALALEGPAFAHADVVLCSEPAIVCVIAHEEGKAIIGYFGVHVAFMLKGSEPQLDLYRRFTDQLAGDSRSTLATVAPYISMQSLYHMPLEIPAVRPLSAYTLPARYTASKPDEVLVNKRPMAFWDVSHVLNVCARAAGDSVLFRDAGELHSLGCRSTTGAPSGRASTSPTTGSRP
ncbi:unnamed protein product [Prorocentrum cordatum]|uniref:Uncharacterized protein n=1 Tax=Prorocentrum cordatum TaxID=2364126 RepID=A0ABN9QLQ5_9DINO|nr:unnamed protein product [Polarella glacialis]